MKKFKIALIVSTLPIYSFIAWIYVFNQNPTSSQEEKVRAYQQWLFNIDLDAVLLAGINLLLSITAIYLLATYTSNRSIPIRIISILLILVLSFISLYNIWGVL